MTGGDDGGGGGAALVVGVGGATVRSQITQVRCVADPYCAAQR